MKHHQKLRFVFVRGLTTIFHVGGLGVVDKRNNTVGSRSYRIFFLNPKKTSTDEKEEHLRNCNNRF